MLDPEEDQPVYGQAQDQDHQHHRQHLGHIAQFPPQGQQLPEPEVDEKQFRGHQKANAANYRLVDGLKEDLSIRRRRIDRNDRYMSG